MSASGYDPGADSGKYKEACSTAKDIRRAMFVRICNEHALQIATLHLPAEAALGSATQVTTVTQEQLESPTILSRDQAVTHAAPTPPIILCYIRVTVKMHKRMLMAQSFAGLV